MLARFHCPLGCFGVTDHRCCFGGTTSCTLCLRRTGDPIPLAALVPRCHSPTPRRDGSAHPLPLLPLTTCGRAIVTKLRVVSQRPTPRAASSPAHTQLLRDTRSITFPTWNCFNKGYSSLGAGGRTHPTFVWGCLGECDLSGGCTGLVALPGFCCERCWRGWLTDWLDTVQRRVLGYMQKSGGVTVLESGACTRPQWRETGYLGLLSVVSGLRETLASTGSLSRTKHGVIWPTPGARRESSRHGDALVARAGKSKDFASTAARQFFPPPNLALVFAICNDDSDKVRSSYPCVSSHSLENQILKHLPIHHTSKSSVPPSKDDDILRDRWIVL